MRTTRSSKTWKIAEYCLCVLLSGTPTVSFAQQRVWQEMTAGPIFSDSKPLKGVSQKAAVLRGDNSGVIVGSWEALSASETESFIATNVDGASWRPLYFSSTSLNDLSFIGSELGWVVGTDATNSTDVRGVAFRTTDGGRTWEKSVPLPKVRENYFTSVTFVSKDRGFIVGAQVSGYKQSALILRTLDGGISWKVVYRGRSKLSYSSYGLRISFAKDGDFGIVAGEDEDGGSVIVTRDGGKNWRRIRVGFDSVRPLVNAAVINEKEAWVSGESESLLHTTDGGSSWKIIRIQPANEATAELLDEVTLSFMAIVFRSSKEGWISGNDGLTLHTDNGGRTWAAEDHGQSDYVRQLLLVGNRVIAVRMEPGFLVRRL
jgi:photosystem II stability/assembly factor-like uncharacterized protein